MCKTLLAFDVDSHALAAHLRNEHPDWFQLAICQLTAKGIHLLFLRSPLCDELGLVDGARQFKRDTVPPEYLDNNNEVPLDIKSICSTGTAGVSAIAPSKGKRWEVPLWECEIREAPEDMVRFLHANKKRAKRPSRRGTLAEPT